MSHFLWNNILALIWMSLQGEFSSANLAFGFLVGYLILLIARPALPPSSYSRKVMQLANLALYLIWHIIIANIQIAWRVLKPRLELRPAVIAVRLSARSDAEITALANLITLTPGTLTVDISPDHSALYVHTMYLQDHRQFTRALKLGLERRVLEVLR
jgi:multicomponent Na+:H+ antiporter subunit E